MKIVMANKKNIPFDKSFASHEKSKYLHKNKNGDIKPENITLKSGDKYIFICNNLECGHEFISSPQNIVSLGRWCYYCCIPSKYLCDDVNCTKCSEKSFACHEKSIYWSTKNELQPNQVFKNCNSKFWFDCPECHHSFESVLSTIFNGSWCPYCSKPPKQLCGKDDCNHCNNNSFASHEKAKYWNYELNGDIKPFNIFTTNRNKYYFNCGECGHIIHSVLSEITAKNRWCAYCSHSKLCDNKDCKKCFEASFESDAKVNMWSAKNGDITPRQVFKSSGKKYWLKCNDCLQDFNVPLSRVIINCYFCPKCLNKTERKLYEKLLNIYKNLIFQYKPDWCKNKLTNRHLPYDFAIEENKIIIELDGLQHFVQVSNWNSPENIQQRDKYKMKQANDNGYSVIRILQEDVYHDKYNWLDELKENIEKIIIEKKIQNIYICKKNEYSVYNVENQGNIDIQDIQDIEDIQENINDIVITEAAEINDIENEDIENEDNEDIDDIDDIDDIEDIDNIDNIKKK